MTDQIKVAAFDIDGTLFRWSFLIEIVERLVARGSISPEAYSSAQEFKLQWRNREVSYIAYLDAIVKIVESKAMKTVSRAALLEVARAVVNEHGGNVYVFTRELLRVVREAGYRTVAISGSVKEAVDLFAELWKIDDVLATELEYDEHEFYTGKVFSTPVHGKGEALRKYFIRLRQPAVLMIAAGDTSSDLSMLRMAKYPIAFNPDGKLKAHARSHGLVCVTERKDSITVFSAPGEGQRKRVPRYFSEMSIASVLPPDIGWALKVRLDALEYKHI